mgnify:FL=1
MRSIAFRLIETLQNLLRLRDRPASSLQRSFLALRLGISFDGGTEQVCTNVGDLFIARIESLCDRAQLVHVIVG